MFIRGNILRRELCQLLIVASMGPRMFIRGNVSCAQPPAGESACFNGAADVHPRKPGRRVVCQRCPSGFNGAADVHPRKRKEGKGEGERERASMGPRMFIRGNEPRAPKDCRVRPASMGPRMFIRGNSNHRARIRARLRRFNGAADVHPRKLGAQQVRLHVEVAVASMGPRMFIRGNVTRARRRSRTWRRFNGAADVHPRKPAGWRVERKVLEASMGPRMFIRGNMRTKPDTASARSRLQWGRGCSSAETRAAWDEGWCSQRLQWGRGCSSAETRSTSRYGINSSSFNGAADVHPRKR